MPTFLTRLFSKRWANFVIVGMATFATPALESVHAAPGEKCAPSKTKDCKRPVAPIPESELEETLKTLPKDLSATLRANLPDLVVSVVAGQTRIKPGDTVELQLTLRNIGTDPAEFPSGGEGDAPPVLRLFKSAPGEALDGYLEGEAAESEPELFLELDTPRVIAPGERAVQRHSLAIREDSKDGVHKLCAVADPEGVVRERNEDNNRACRNLYVDAAVPAGSVSPEDKELIQLPPGTIRPREGLKRLPDLEKADPDPEKDE